MAQRLELTHVAQILELTHVAQILRAAAVYTRSDHPIFDIEVNFGISVPTFFIPELKIFFFILIQIF